MATDRFSGSDGDLCKNEAISSSFIKTVCLDDWWLIRTEKDSRGKRLAVGGFTSKEQQAIRAFSSSPIFKKYDAFTLETADGITVMVQGLINRDRTLQNGFPSEVCSHFLFGFPYDWEAYSGECFHRESTIPGVPLSSPVCGECNDDVRNSGETSNAGNCNCEAIKDEGPSVPISSNVKNISPSKVNVLVQLGASTNFPVVSSRKLSASNEKGKHDRKFKDEDGLEVKEEVSTVNFVEEALNGGNMSGLARGGVKETAEKSFSTTSNVRLPKISEKGVDPMVIIGSKVNVSSPSEVKQNKYLDRRVSDKLKNLKANQKGNSDSTLCVTNEDNKPNSMLETFENPTGEKHTGKSESKKNPPGGKKDSKGIHHHSRTRQSTSGLRNLKSKLSKDQATGGCHETGTDEVNPVSVDSVLVNDIRKDIGHKSKGKSALNLPVVGLKEMMAEEVDSMYPLHWTPLDNISSLSPESVKRPQYPSVTDQGSAETTNQNEDKEPDCVKVTEGSVADSANQNEDFGSLITPGNLKNTICLKVSVGAGERSAEEISTSGKKAKRKQLSLACSTRHRMKKSSIVSPESLSCKRSKLGRLILPPLASWENQQVVYDAACSIQHKMKKSSIVSPESLSYKRSRLGRLILPPLAFWENQQVVYDADGQITGIQNGLPAGEYSAGSKSDGDILHSGGTTKVFQRRKKKS